MKAFEYTSPTTVRETVALLDEKGDFARILAGGTDLIVQMRDGKRNPDWLIDIKKIPEVNELRFDPTAGLIIGSAVPCYRIAEIPEIARKYPALVDAVSLIGGVQIQSRASIGGNLCNASPAADSIPAMIACEGICIIAGPKGMRELPVDMFCTSPGKTVLGRGEFLVSLRFPAPLEPSGSAYLRFIPRNEMDIAVVGVGVSVTLDTSKSRCLSARLGLAAVAPTPLLVQEFTGALVGTSLSETDIEKAAKLAQLAARPISDMRGDAEYRRHLVGVLVKRALHSAINRAKEI